MFVMGMRPPQTRPSPIDAALIALCSDVTISQFYQFSYDFVDAKQARIQSFSTSERRGMFFHLVFGQSVPDWQKPAAPVQRSLHEAIQLIIRLLFGENVR
jgi:hypothetical protein